MDEEKVQNNNTDEAISRNSAMMTGIVLVSRLTGFVRTWAQAFALGASMLASCYTVANNLPNLLFEITIAGMLYTAFLPVYMSVKRKSGLKGASEYTSNMASIICLLMGVLTILAFIFAAPLVFTQSAGAEAETFSFETAQIFFRFFCVEVLFYPLSALLTSVLNAERKFFWGQAAPIFNNIIVILSFLVGLVFLSDNYYIGFLIIALGNPIGVAVQLFVQLPSLKKTGIKLKFGINFSDPSLIETVKIGVPSLLVTVCAAVLASVQSSCSLVDNTSGAAILYYVRVWFVLPASLLSVPLSTAIFTELSDLFANKDKEEFKTRTVKGIEQILFFMIPFTFYLIVFSRYLMALLGSSNFSDSELDTSTLVLATMSLSLAFYALTPYLQNVFAAMHRLRFYSATYLVITLLSSLFCVLLADNIGIYGVAASYPFFYVLMVAVMIARLYKVLGNLNLKRVVLQSFFMLILGLLGAACGYGVCLILSNILSISNHPSFVQSVICLLFGGVVSVVVTYGVAYALKIPSARTIFAALIHKISR